MPASMWAAGAAMRGDVAMPEPVDGVLVPLAVASCRRPAAGRRPGGSAPAGSRGGRRPADGGRGGVREFGHQALVAADHLDDRV